MNRALKWSAGVLGGIVLLAALAVGVVFLFVGRDLSVTYDVAGSDIPVPTDPASIREGERQARILGCNNGCHGDEGSHGAIFFELPDGSRMVAPDLHRIAAMYSTADLERAIRHGVRPDGKTLFGAMPSEMFYNLSDRHLGQIIAYLRSRPAGEALLPDSRIGPMMRGMLLYYQRAMGWQPYAAAGIDHDAPRPADDPGNPVSYGHYLAQTSCTECHGADLKGDPGGSTPDLAVAAAYSQADFIHLLRTGEPAGDRELDLMAQVATQRFANFTDDEIAALHAYLRHRAGIGSTDGS